MLSGAIRKKFAPATTSRIFKSEFLPLTAIGCLKEDILLFVLSVYRDEVAGDSSSKERAEAELNKLKVTITAKEKDLESIKPQVCVVYICERYGFLN